MSRPLRRPLGVWVLLFASGAGLVGCGSAPARSLPPPEYETPTLPPFPAPGAGEDGASGGPSPEAGEPAGVEDGGEPPLAPPAGEKPPSAAPEGEPPSGAIEPGSTPDPRAP